MNQLMMVYASTWGIVYAGLLILIQISPGN
jgi:hypothetical protein